MSPLPGHWPEGPPVAGLSVMADPLIDASSAGLTAVHRQADRWVLTCDLDANDPRRQAGVVWFQVAAAAGEYLDLIDHGAFVSLIAPPEFVKIETAGRALAVGVRDAAGEQLWSSGHPILTAGEPTRAGVYPEMRWPGTSYTSGRLDPGRVVQVGVRVSLKGRSGAFSGTMTMADLRVSAAPPDVAGRRRLAAERLGADRWLYRVNNRPATAQRTEPVPIETFLENSGVDFPWPRHVYPPVGARPWNRSRGGFSAETARLADDFAYLVEHRVRLIRMFIFCDARTGFTERDGRLELDSMAMADVRALLDTLAKFPSLRLAPVLFDFHLANGIDRENRTPVGEHPDWITDPVRRGQLVAAVGPVIDAFCAHPQVAFVDLINEPEHAVAVWMDDLHAFVGALAERVRQGPVRKPSTVGSARTGSALFWMSAGIDRPTAHWFAKMSPSHPLGQRPAALDPAGCIMTEVDPGAGVAEALTRLWRGGYAGACFWSLHAADGYDFRGPPAEEFKQWVERHRPAAKE
ncbi:MAG: hypothetical protein HRF43_02675 [Phycisphaerae bacterium]